MYNTIIAAHNIPSEDRAPADYLSRLTHIIYHFLRFLFQRIRNSHFRMFCLWNIKYSNKFAVFLFKGKKKQQHEVGISFQNRSEQSSPGKQRSVNVDHVQAENRSNLFSTSSYVPPINSPTYQVTGKYYHT
jgi:hypothetical protein